MNSRGRAYEKDSLARRQMAFRAALIAAATHEFQNHLAVIKEYGGLAGDLLGASRKKDLQAAAKRSAEISGSIAGRATTAAALVDMLNRFAHRADPDVVDFRLEEAVEEIVALLQRQIAQKKQTLRADCRREGITVEAQPCLFQLLLYSAITNLAERLGEGAGISVSCAPDKPGMATAVISATGFPGDAGAQILPPLEFGQCIDELSAVVSETLTDGAASVAISVPLKAF